jgi:hypothetical protein
MGRRSRRSRRKRHGAATSPPAPQKAVHVARRRMSDRRMAVLSLYLAGAGVLFSAGQTAVGVIAIEQDQGATVIAATATAPTDPSQAQCLFDTDFAGVTEAPTTNWGWYAYQPSATWPCSVTS